MSVTETEEAAMVMVETGLSPSKSLKEVKIGKKLQGKCLRLISTEFPVQMYCCYAVISVLIVAVIALSFALSLSGKPDIENCQPFFATCPRNWIGFGSKCFYYSEDMRNWTFSQASCRVLEAHLARFDSLEELNFLKRYKGPSDHWIGLHRKSAEHPWMWTDNTEYNSSVPTRGRGETAYLSKEGISSAREYTHRKWICSKSNRYVLQVPKIFEGA